jgi:hypothetical protein
MFSRTHGKSVAGGLANVAAVNGVTGLNLIHSDLVVATTWRLWPTAVSTTGIKLATAAVMMRAFFIRAPTDLSLGG